MTNKDIKILKLYGKSHIQTISVTIFLKNTYFSKCFNIIKNCNLNIGGIKREFVLILRTAGNQCVYLHRKRGQVGDKNSS
jgi:hypothetical protein